MLFVEYSPYNTLDLSLADSLYHYLAKRISNLKKGLNYVSASCLLRIIKNVIPSKGRDVVLNVIKKCRTSLVINIFTSTVNCTVPPRNYLVISGTISPIKKKSSSAR